MDTPFEDKPVNPLEAEIRRIVRDEIVRAFRKMAEESRSWGGGDILESTALRQFENILDSTIYGMTQEEES